MNKSFNFNDDNYTARIRITTHRPILLEATEDIVAWIDIFSKHKNIEMVSSVKANLEKCITVLNLAYSCYASSVIVSCSADVTGIHVSFNFKFDDEVSLEEFKKGINHKSMQDDNKKALLKF